MVQVAQRPEGEAEADDEQPDTMSDALTHAARSGNFELVQWLRISVGRVDDTDLLFEAARAGQQALCERLVAEGYPWSPEAPGRAARSG